MQEPERLSPLQPPGGEAVVLRLPDLVVEERPFTRKLSIRGRPHEATFVTAFQQAFGVEPPRPGMTKEIASVTILWSGPTEWLVVHPPSIDESRTERVIIGGLLSVDVSSATTTLRLSGAGVHWTLRKVSALPFAGMPNGTVARTRIGRLAILAHAIKPACLDLYVSRSFARSFFEQLRDAAEMS